MSAVVVAFVAGALCGAVSLHGFGAWYLARHGVSGADITDAIDRARR